jgi:hypothetical protein
MRLSLTILFFCIHIFLSGQTYSFQQVKDSSYSTIENQIGKDLAQFFELPPDNMGIAYDNWRGKRKVKWIEVGQKFKTKRLKVVSLFLIFNHPDLPSLDDNISFFIDFDKTLSTLDTFDLYKIPKYIREGRSIDWLSQQERREITDTLRFEKNGWKMLSSIHYDRPSKKYYFEIKSIYDSNGGYYYYENYWINVISGKIEKHFYSKYYVCSVI